MKKIQDYLVFAVIVLVMLGVSSQSINAQTNAEDDPEYWKTQGYISSGYFDRARSVDYGVSAAIADGGSTVRLGVDVSRYQKNVNWAKAKAQGVEFAIIRVGYRGSNSGTLNEDEYYIRNIEGALAQGIPVGVYFFSQAVTESEAVEEANYVLDRVRGYNLSLPIVIDYEYAGQNGKDGRLYAANLSRIQMTSICKTFCKTVQDAGYRGMVYANKSMLTSDLNADEIAKDYCIWLAHYTTATNYTGAYDFWQFTSTGDGAAYGMQSQYVDLDYWYDDGSLYNAVYDGIDYSAVYDYSYYIAHNRGVYEEYGNDANAVLRHFVMWGMDEGRQAKATFNVYSYKNRYEGLREEFGSDLRAYYMHYINYGEREGRIATGYENTTDTDTETEEDKTYVTIYNGVDYSAVYDYSYYIAHNQGVYEEYGNDANAVLRHFVMWGMDEGRRAKATFDVHSYKNRYEGLREEFGSDLRMYYMHYINYGEREGRIATGYDDINTEPEEEPTDGTVYDGVDYSAVYDYSYYIAHNLGVYEEYGDNANAVLRHFVTWGMDEGRQAKETFNVHAYKNRYVGLQEEYGSNLRAYYMHYINYGENEGRIAY